MRQAQAAGGQSAQPLQLRHQRIELVRGFKPRQQGHRVVVEQGAQPAAGQLEVLLHKGAHRQKQQLVPLGALARGGQVHPHHRRGPGAGGQFQFVAGGPLAQLVRGDAPVQQAGEEQLPQHRQALLVAAAQSLHVPPLLALGLQLGAQARQHFLQFPGVHRLHDVFRDAHAHRLTGVFKVVKAGKHHQLRRGQLPPQPAAELQPVHEGHLDVGEHHVQADLLRQFQRLGAVFRLARQNEPLRRPVDLAADALADLRLVVCQKDPILFHPAPSLSLSVYHTRRALKTAKRAPFAGRPQRFLKRLIS